MPFPDGLLARHEHGVVRRERFFLLLLDDAVPVGRSLRQLRTSAGENCKDVAELPSTCQQSVFLRHCVAYRPQHLLRVGGGAIFLPIAKLATPAAPGQSAFVEFAFMFIHAAWLAIMLILAMIVLDRKGYHGRFHLLCWMGTRIYIEGRNIIYQNIFIIDGLGSSYR